MTTDSVPSRLVTHRPRASQSLARRVLAWILLWVVNTLTRTFKVSLHGPEPPLDRPTIFAFQHGRQLALLRHPRPPNTVVLTSLSADGGLQASVLAALGFNIVRGSTSRGGDAGLVAIVRAVKQGAAAAVAVDGPRGPEGVVKPGALFLARATRGVVVPISCAASRFWRLNRSWDKFIVPAPWSRVALVRGQPMTFSNERNESDFESSRSILERELMKLNEAAESFVRGQRRCDT